MTRRFAFLLLALSLPLAASGCVIVTDDGSSTLSVTNRSSFVLTEIRVADIDAPTWGPNLLGGDVLYPDESLDVSVDCGNYDALVVDETGAECTLPNIDLCFDNAEWVISDAALSQCDTFGARLTGESGKDAG